MPGQCLCSLPCTGPTTFAAQRSAKSQRGVAPPWSVYRLHSDGRKGPMQVRVGPYAALALRQEKEKGHGPRPCAGGRSQTNARFETVHMRLQPLTSGALASPAPASLGRAGSAFSGLVNRPAILPSTRPSLHAPRAERRSVARVSGTSIHWPAHLTSQLVSSEVAQRRPPSTGPLTCAERGPS